jgi:hypothetical protein
MHMVFKASESIQSVNNDSLVLTKKVATLFSKFSFKVNTLLIKNYKKMNYP